MSDVPPLVPADGLGADLLTNGIRRAAELDEVSGWQSDIFNDVGINLNSNTSGASQIKYDCMILVSRV